MDHSKSSALLAAAQKVLVGGVNSPVRAFKAVGGTPPFIASAQGARLVDEDGNSYLDYVCSWGPLLLGHRHPSVVMSVQKAMERGFSFGAPTKAEIQLAEAVIAKVPGIEKVRFVNSGTEATMSALRLARAATSRDKFIKFSGCYHGHSDGLLVRAGSGATTFGIPDSPGVPESYAALTLSCEFNDLDSVRKAFIEHPNAISAIILEPVVGNMGLVPPDPGFLEGLRQITQQEGALLIFDEVMTGFRIHEGGAATLYGVTPDLYCFGKIIGGGLPVGAYAGPARLMDQIAPLGKVYQAGTLSGNPLAMASGIATLEQLTPAVYAHVEKLGQQLEDGLRQAAAAANIALCVQRVGSMITPFFQAGPVRNYDDAMQSNTAQFKAFHAGMLDLGHYLPASQYEAWFISAAHTHEDIAQTVEAAGKVFRSMQSQP